MGTMSEQQRVQPAVTVTQDADGSAFVATLEDGTVAGTAYYHLLGGALVFTHTEVDPALEGQGIGSRLVAGALAAAREAGAKVVPLCPFVRAYMARHPEHDGLLRTYTDLGTRKAGPGA
jgi:predicted GNAT family acetyltransferase